MSDSRAQILGNIARALAGHSTDTAPLEADRPERPESDLLAIGSEETLRRFAENLARVGGESHILADEEAALSQLRGILGEYHGQSVLVPPDTELDRMAVPRIVQETGCIAVDPKSVLLEVASKASVGITLAHGGIADTGTIMLIHATLADQLSALLPPLHVALLKRETICSNKARLLASLKAGATNLSTVVVTWVTGPSLTADIEKVLVRGAHGPRRVVVLIY